MQSKTIVSRRDLWMRVMLACAAAVAVQMPAHAQASAPDLQEQVTIQAPQYQERRVPILGHKYGLVEAEVVLLSRHVGHADLDLSRPADAVELERRINSTAREVCDELKRRNSGGHMGVIVDRNCVKVAVDDAMVAAKRVIARAG
jgi:UrcA family protein